MARLSLQRALAKARKTGVTGEKNSSRDSLESETELGGGKKKRRERNPLGKKERIHIKDFIAYDKLLWLT